MGGAIHSPPISLNQACSTFILNHVTEATNCYCKSAMTWAFHNSAMFSSVIKAKNLQLYKKLQNLLSMFQKLKSSGFKFERFGGEKTQSSRFVFDRFLQFFCKTRYTRRANPGFHCINLEFKGTQRNSLRSIDIKRSQIFGYFWLDPSPLHATWCQCYYINLGTVRWAHIWGYPPASPPRLSA